MSIEEQNDKVIGVKFADYNMQDDERKSSESETENPITNETTQNSNHVIEFNNKLPDTTVEDDVSMATDIAEHLTNELILNVSSLVDVISKEEGISLKSFDTIELESSSDTSSIVQYRDENVQYKTISTQTSFNMNHMETKSKKSVRIAGRSDSFEFFLPAKPEESSISIDQIEQFTEPTLTHSSQSPSTINASWSEDTSIQRLRQTFRRFMARVRRVFRNITDTVRFTNQLRELIVQMQQFMNDIRNFITRMRDRHRSSDTVRPKM